LGEFYIWRDSDGFKTFYTCEPALLRLTEDWGRMRDMGNWLQYSHSHAFDVIQHDLLLIEIQACGVGEGSCALLSGRQQQVTM